MTSSHALFFRLLVVCLPAVLTVGQETGATANSYSGEAAVVRANVLGIKTSLSDTGSVGASGGERTSSALTFNLPALVTGEAAHATAFARGNISASEAAMENLHVTVGANVIASNLLLAIAHARCTASGVIVSSDPNIMGLVVNGKSIPISGKPNQTVALPDGKIIVNEQAKTSTKTSGHISVSAMHIIVTGVADIAFSEANAGISCPSGPENCGNDDFTTGGGFITVTSGARANFGVAGFEQNGKLYGHLEYIDHGVNGPSVHGTSVTGYTQINATTREIDGTANVNGHSSFTYQALITDHDPSGPDTFSIHLSDGYAATGNLGGGHVEIHRDCEDDDD